MSERFQNHGLGRHLLRLDQSQAICYCRFLNVLNDGKGARNRAAHYEPTAVQAQTVFVKLLDSL